MLTRQDLSPADRRRFQTGRPSLDLSHTGGQGRFAAFELLHAPADLERWLGLLVGTAVDARDADVDRVRDVRNAIGRAARAVAAGAAPARRDVELVNGAAAHSPLVPRLGDGGAALRPGTAEQALSTLARDAIDVLGGPLAARIRVCAAEDCGLLFVDQSRPGRRRWCSMERCGNRAKTRRYRGRV